MKKFFSKIIFISLLYSFSVFAATENLVLDPSHTYVLWHIKHFGFSSQAGKWYAEGNLALDKDQPQNSKVNATIHIADIVTGIAELDKHLKGKLFFDAETFPTATFVSDKVEMLTKNSAKIYGTLTLHGIKRPLVLAAKLNQAGINPVTGQMTAGFSAGTIIKRSDFGMRTLLPGLGDEVKIDIEAEAYKPKQ